MKIPTFNLPLKNWRTIVTGLVCLSIITACTMKSLYLQLDWIIPQFIEEYIPLNEKQAQELRLNLQKTLNWHRSTQLPEYVRWLKSLKQDIKQGLKQDSVIQHTRQLEQYWDTLLDYISEDSAVLLYSTSKEQRDTLFKTFRKKNDQYKKKNIDADSETLRQNLVTQISDEYERWLGHLDPGQRKLIEETGKQLKPVGQLHLENRLRLQKKLKFLLEKTPTFENFKIGLKDLFLNRENFYSKEYKDAIQYNKTILINLVATMAASLSDEQKKYLLQKIDYYIDICNALLIKK